MSVNLWPLFSIPVKACFYTLLHVYVLHVQPQSCTGHFLLDRSQIEQLSMRVTQMMDSLHCWGQRGYLSTGTCTLEPKPPTPKSPVPFTPSILPRIKNHQCLCHFHYKPIAGSTRGAEQLLSQKQISSTTQRILPMGEALKWIICL